MAGILALSFACEQIPDHMLKDSEDNIIGAFISNVDLNDDVKSLKALEAFNRTGLVDASLFSNSDKRDFVM